MPNEQIERYLLDLLMRLTAEEGGEILENLLSTGSGGGEAELPFEKRPAGAARRILRENERFDVGADVEALFIELQEMRLLPPERAEKFLEKIRENDCGSFDSTDAIRLVSALLRAEGAERPSGGTVVLEGFGGEMTAH